MSLLGQIDLGRMHLRYIEVEEAHSRNALKRTGLIILHDCDVTTKQVRTRQEAMGRDGNITTMWNHFQHNILFANQNMNRSNIELEMWQSLNHMNYIFLRYIINKNPISTDIKESICRGAIADKYDDMVKILNRKIVELYDVELHPCGLDYKCRSMRRDREDFKGYTYNEFIEYYGAKDGYYLWSLSEPYYPPSPGWDEPGMSFWKTDAETDYEVIEKHWGKLKEETKELYPLQNKKGMFGYLHK